MLLLLDMLLVYYLQKTKLCSKNLKRLAYQNVSMINMLKNNCKTNLEHQLGNAIWYDLIKTWEKIKEFLKNLENTMSNKTCTSARRPSPIHSQQRPGWMTTTQHSY